VWSLQLVAGTVISPVLAHVMGPTEFGAIALAIALHQLLSVFALFGIDQALVLQRAEDGDAHAARGLLSLGILVSAVVAIGAGLTAPLWSPVLGFSEYPELVFAVTLWTAPAAAVQVMLSFLLAEDRLRPFALVSALAAVGGQLCGLVLLFTVANNATTYALGSVASQFAAMLIGVVVTRPRLAGLLEWRINWRAITLGFPLAMGGLAYFALGAGDRVVIQRFLGSEEVGRYQVSYVVGAVVLMLLAYTNSAWAPRFAAVRDEAERWAMSVRTRDQLYRILLPVIIGMTLAAPLLLRIVAPASFRPESLTIVVFLVSLTAFPVAASGASGRLLLTLRRGKTTGIIAGVAAVLNLGLNILLVPLMGITGAALTTVCAYSVLAILQRHALPRQHDFAAPSPRLVFAIIATVLFAGSTILLPQTFEWNLARFVAALACLPWFFLRLRSARLGPTLRSSRRSARRVSEPRPLP
jgi:O-antigen/teichoic acid export membrane protein